MTPCTIWILQALLIRTWCFRQMPQTNQQSLVDFNLYSKKRKPTTTSRANRKLSAAVSSISTSSKSYSIKVTRRASWCKEEHPFNLHPEKWFVGYPIKSTLFLQGGKSIWDLLGHGTHFFLIYPAFSQVATIENLRCFCQPERIG